MAARGAARRTLAFLIHLAMDFVSSRLSSTCKVVKAGMKLNDYLPSMEVDPETYEVRADGELLTYCRWHGSTFFSGQSEDKIGKCNGS